MIEPGFLIHPRFKNFPMLRHRKDAMWHWFTRGSARHSTWFAHNPEREFRLATISVQMMDDFAASGYFAGCASVLIGNNAPWEKDGGVYITPDLRIRAANAPRSLHCIVRRDDPTRGRLVPEVFLLDGMTTPSAPPNGAPAPDVDEEGYCAAWWACADALRALGVGVRWPNAEMEALRLHTYYRFL